MSHEASLFYVCLHLACQQLLAKEQRMRAGCVHIFMSHRKTCTSGPDAVGFVGAPKAEDVNKMKSKRNRINTK